MNGATRQYILGVMTVATGGGILQMVRFLLTRRSSLHSLDTKTLADERTSAEPIFKEYKELVNRFKASEEAAVAATAAVEQARQLDRAEAAHSLDLAHAEITRLTKEVSRLRIDLDIAAGEVEQLRRLLRQRPEGP